MSNTFVHKPVKFVDSSDFQEVKKHINDRVKSYKDLKDTKRIRRNDRQTMHMITRDPEFWHDATFEDQRIDWYLFI